MIGPGLRLRADLTCARERESRPLGTAPADAPPARYVASPVVSTPLISKRRGGDYDAQDVPGVGWGRPLRRDANHASETRPHMLRADHQRPVVAAGPLCSTAGALRAAVQTTAMPVLRPSTRRETVAADCWGRGNRSSARVTRGIPVRGRSVLRNPPSGDGGFSEALTTRRTRRVSAWYRDRFGRSAAADRSRSQWRLVEGGRRPSR